MNSAELEQKVRDLRAQGLSPKQISRALEVRPADVAPLIRAIAERSAAEAPEPRLVGCWVNSGWSSNLSWDGHEGWREGSHLVEGPRGLLSVLVAREARSERVSVCTWLLDVFCLGAKNVVGPRVMRTLDLAQFRRELYAQYPQPPVEAPLELVQHLVVGAAEYARSLGFEPHPDFEACRPHLGPFVGPSAVRFGLDGKPFFVQGPRDDSARVLQTLRDSVGEGNFDFVMNARDW